MLNANSILSTLPKFSLANEIFLYLVRDCPSRMLAGTGMLELRVNLSKLWASLFLLDLTKRANLGDTASQIVNVKASD